MDQTSPRLNARITGLLWLIVIIAGTTSNFINLTPPLVPGDAAAALNGVLAAADVYRQNLVADMVAGACYTGVAVILYTLLRPVNRIVALTAASFGLIGVTVGMIVSLCRFAPLVFAADASATTSIPLEAMAVAFLKLHGSGFAISMVCFGLHCFLSGAVILGAAFLPRFLGVLLMVAGGSYLFNSLAGFFSPPLAQSLFPYMAAAGFTGEGAMTLWLLLAGVNAGKWKLAAQPAPSATAR